MLYSLCLLFRCMGYMEALENVSVMVRIVLYVFESSSFTMKSMAIDVNGRVLMR